MVSSRLIKSLINEGVNLRGLYVASISATESWSIIKLW